MLSIMEYVDNMARVEMPDGIHKKVKYYAIDNELNVPQAYEELVLLALDNLEGKNVNIE